MESRRLITRNATQAQYQQRSFWGQPQLSVRTLFAALLIVLAWAPAIAHAQFAGGNSSAGSPWQIASTPVVIIEPGIDVRKIHWLGIDEFRTGDGAFGSDRRTREQQPGKRACFATFIVLVIHAWRVHYLMTGITAFYGMIGVTARTAPPSA